MTNLPKPPSHLSKKAQQFFKNFVSDFEVDESATEVLTRICESIDRADQAAGGLKKNGSLITLDRFGVVKAHPLAAVERQARAAIVDGLKALGAFKEQKAGDRYSRKVF